MSISPTISARLSALLLHSLYQEDQTGRLALVEPLTDLVGNPWFWPVVGERIICNVIGEVPLVGPVLPKRNPLERIPRDRGLDGQESWEWRNVVEMSESGEPIIVGRIPSYREFFDGNPPSEYKSELTLAEAEQFLRTVSSASRAGLIAYNFFNHSSQPKATSLLGPKITINRDVEPFTPRNPDNRPILPPDSPRNNAPGSNCFERLCCIGLDIEKRVVTAIVEITQSTGYGGTLCNSISFESVGFWLSEPSHTELDPNTWPDKPTPNPFSSVDVTACGGSLRFIGSTRFTVADIPRSTQRAIDCTDDYYQYQPGVLNYSVSVPLSDADIELILTCSKSARLPLLHALVAWNQDVTNDNFRGRGIFHGDWLASVVQYPVRRSPACRRLESGVVQVRLIRAITRAVPVHVASLPNGDILFFSGAVYRKEISKGVYDKSNSVALFHPKTNTIENLGNPPFDIFCSGHSTLANGNVLILGGSRERSTDHLNAHGHWIGLNDATVYDWKSKKFIFGQDAYGEALVQKMLEGRWYPSTLVLGTGDVYVCDGHPSKGWPMHTNFILEIYNAKGTRIIRSHVNGNISAGSNFVYDTTRILETDKERFDKPFTQPAESEVGLYPRLFLLPDGDVFSASVLRSLPIYERRNELGRADLDDKTRENIRVMDDGGYTYNGDGRVLQDNSYTFNPNKPWDYKRVYEGPPYTGPLFSSGGSAVILPFTVPLGENNVRVEDTEILSLTNGKAYTIHPLSDNPTWLSTKRERLSLKDRIDGNMVLLPTGKVMIVGGMNPPMDIKAEGQEKERLYDKSTVNEIEYYDPTNRTWSFDKVLTLTIPRRYHSTAILLIDGRILVGGSDKGNPVIPDRHHPEGYQDTLEILTPDYYQNGPQPVIALNVESITYGERLSVYLEDNWTIAQVEKHAVLIRCSSVTHAFGYDQRAVKIAAIITQSDDQFQVCIPINPNLMPPGYYMLFVVSISGVPSCGRMVQIV